jgi:hypothetical protein
MWTKLDYIHLNPVRAGIVEKASPFIPVPSIMFPIQVVENRKTDTQLLML